MANQTDKNLTQRLAEYISVQKYEERIKYLEQQNDALSTEVSRVKKDRDRISTEQDGIFTTLNSQLDNKTMQIKGLERRIRELEDENERISLDFENKLDDMKSSHNHIVADLNLKIIDLEKKLDSLERFQQLKDDYNSRVKKLQDEVEDQKRQRIEEVTELERKHLREKQKMKADNEKKLQETRTNLKALTEQRLHATTRRTIEENERFHMELKFQSAESEKIVLRSAKLEEELKTLRQELSLSRQLQKEQAERTLFHQKIIRRLHTKLKEAQAQLSHVTSNKQPKHSGRLSPATEELVKVLEEKLDEAETKLFYVLNESDSMREDFISYQREHQQHQGQLGEVLTLLTAALQEEKQRLGESLGVSDMGQVPLNVNQLDPSTRVKLGVQLIEAVGQAYCKPCEQNQPSSLPRIPKVNLERDPDDPTSSLLKKPLKSISVQANLFPPAPPSYPASGSQTDRGHYGHSATQLLASLGPTGLMSLKRPNSKGGSPSPWRSKILSKSLDLM